MRVGISILSLKVTDQIPRELFPKFHRHNFYGVVYFFDMLLMFIFGADHYLLPGLGPRLKWWVKEIFKGAEAV